jgi:hypothetical protein
MKFTHWVSFLHKSGKVRMNFISVANNLCKRGMYVASLPYQTWYRPHHRISRITKR